MGTLLHAVPHLLCAARGFPGGAEGIDGEEMSNGRFRSEEKISLTYTGEKDGGEQEKLSSLGYLQGRQSS